jgi:hypothetical protein
VLPLITEAKGAANLALAVPTLHGAISVFAGTIKRVFNESLLAVIYI